MNEPAFELPRRYLIFFKNNFRSSHHASVSFLFFILIIIIGPSDKIINFMIGAIDE